MKFTSKKFVVLMSLFIIQAFLILFVYNIYINKYLELTRHLKNFVERYDVLQNPYILLGGRKNICKNCFSHNYKFVINNEHICYNNGMQPIDAIILIFTAHHSKHQRDTIRNTWLTRTRNNTANVRYAFLLGGSNSSENHRLLLAENQQHRDILQEDFADTYKNLTLKTIMAFRWASVFCSNANFVMKTDDDTYVNIQGLLYAIKEHAQKLQSSIGGYCMNDVIPIRDPASKWFASYFSYPNSIYPEFCSGTGYVTSLFVAKRVLEISKHIPFFHLEDVYVSFCMKKLNLTLQNIRGFYNYPIRNNPCVYKADGFVTSHKISPPEMLKIWNTTCD